MQIKYVKLQYPNVSMRLGDSPKLRGYFASRYSDNNFLHNHGESGVIFRYPKIQYKIIHSTPTLIGLNDGADAVLLAGVNENIINIDNTRIDMGSATIESKLIDVGISNTIHNYMFMTPWVALNQHNTETFFKVDEITKEELLEKILIGNILSFSKGIGYNVESKIRVKLTLKKIDIKLKGCDMLGFVGGFKTNFILPEYAGLGRSTARGFGAITQSNV